MLPSFAKETIPVLRARTVTERGTARDDWTTPAEHQLERCITEHATSTETGLAIADTFILRAPFDADLTAKDRVRLPTGIYKVEGDPIRIASPTGRLSHTVATLTRHRG